MVIVRSRRVASTPSAQRLALEPDVLKTRAVVDAVANKRQALAPFLQADRRARVEEHGSYAVIGQLPLDLPHQLAARLDIGFHRLAVDQLVEIRVAVAAVIAFGRAGKAFVESLVRIVEATLHRQGGGGGGLSGGLWGTSRGVDGFEAGGCV